MVSKAIQFSCDVPQNTSVTYFVPLPFTTDDGIAAGLSQRQREFFDEPRRIVVDDDGDIPSFACPHPRLGNRYQRTVSLHSYSFTFLFRNNFKPHLISPTLYRGHGCPWICRQFAKTMSVLRARTAEIGQASAADRRNTPALLRLTSLPLRESKALLLPDGQISGRARELLVQPHLQKYSGFPKTQITLITLAIPSHTEGRFAIVTNVRRDAVDADGAADEST